MSDALPGDLTTGPLLKRTFRFGMPLCLAMMGHGLFNLVDLLIVGRLAEGAVAAVTVGGIAVTVAMLFFDGVGNSVVAHVARARGRGDDDAVTRFAFQSLLLALIAGGILGGLFVVLAGPIFRLFALGNESATAAGVEFLAIMGGSMVTTFLIIQSTAVFRGVGNALWPLVILLGSNVLNVVLDVLLVFGLHGFPRMGVVGAAWATAISRAVAAVLGLYLLARGVGGVTLVPKTLRWSLRSVPSLVKEGLPTSIQLGFRVIGMLLVLYVARSVYDGSPSLLLDSIGVCIRLEMVAVFAGLGWGAAATAIVGQNLGAGHEDRVRKGTVWAIAWGTLFMGSLGILIWVFRVPLLRTVMPDITTKGVSLASEYLAITVPAYVMLGVAVITSRALNGAGVTRLPMVIDGVLIFAILWPLALWLPKFFDAAPLQPVRGVWWAVTLTHALGAVVYLALLRRRGWSSVGD